MRRILGYVIVHLLALFLRGGVLAMLIEAASLSPMTAIIPVTVVSSTVTLVGTHRWLLQRGEGGNEYKGNDDHDSRQPPF